MKPLQSLIAASWLVAVAPAQVTLQLYDVRDIVAATTIADEVRDESAMPGAERMASFLRAFVDPKLDDDEDIRGLKGGNLIVRAKPERHEWVRRMLRDVRQRADEMIVVEMTIIDVPRAVFERVVAPVFQAEPAIEGQKVDRQSTTIFAPGEATDAWVAQLTQKEPGIEALQAPRLLALPLTQTQISAGEEVAYIRDWVAKDAEKMIDEDHAIHDTVFDGMRIETTAASLGDEIAVAYDFTQSELERPIPTFETTLTSGKHVSIDLPSVTKTRITKKAVLPNGGLVLTSVPRKEGSFLVFLLRATRIEKK